MLDNPVAVTVDAMGNIYVSDASNSRIRKINTAGIINTIVGNGTNGFSGDGGQATDAGLGTDGLALDAIGNIYLADNSNNRIRKVNTLGIISTIAGNGVYGISGDGGQAINAEFTYPTGVAVDLEGNLYIVDSFNNRIRKVSPPLTITVNSLPLMCVGSAATLTASGATTYSWLPATGLNSTSGNNIIASPTVTTSYTVTGYSGDSMGVAISTVTIDVPTIISNSVSICVGNTATLTASGASTYTWNTGVTGATIIPSPTVTTNYIVIGTDANNCTNTYTTTVEIISSPTISFAMLQDTLATYTWDVYPNYSANVANARWYWGDNTSTMGLYPSHTFASASMYNICVTGYNSCGDSTNFCQNDSIYRLSHNNNTNSNMIQVNVINANATGIHQLSVSNSQINIYPNPSSGSINIISTNNIDELKITNMLGQLVYDAKPHIANTTLQLDDAGVYFVTIKQGVETNTRKVIVNK